MAWRRHRCGRRRHLAETGAPSHEPDRCRAFQRGRCALLAAECLCGVSEEAPATPSREHTPVASASGGARALLSGRREMRHSCRAAPSDAAGRLVLARRPHFSAHECKARVLHSCARKIPPRRAGGSTPAIAPPPLRGVDSWCGWHHRTALSRGGPPPARSKVGKSEDADATSQRPQRHSAASNARRPRWKARQRSGSCEGAPVARRRPPPRPVGPTRPVRRSYARSMTTAMPWPPPMHALPTPIFLPFCASV